MMTRIEPKFHAIKLKKPVLVSGVSVGEIKIREPQMNDIFNAGIELLQPDKMTSKQINALASNLAQWTPDEVGSLAPSDWAKVAQHIAGFLS